MLGMESLNRCHEREIKLRLEAKEKVLKYSLYFQTIFLSGKTDNLFQSLGRYSGKNKRGSEEE